MKLKRYRKENNFSQDQMAQKLEDHAKKMFPNITKQLKQTTLGYWERGTLPRKFWLKVLNDFTGGQVGAVDFVNTDSPDRAQPVERSMHPAG